MRRSIPHLARASLALLLATRTLGSCGGSSGGTAGTGGGGETGGKTGTGGTAGAAGRGGTTGSAGVTGTAGTTGAAGQGGTTGSAGTTGVAGTTGAAGQGGTTGSAGAAGAAAGRGGTTGSAGAGGAAGGAAGSTGCSASGTYDQLVLCDHPVAYWAMSKGSGSEPDLTGNDNAGTYKGSATALTTLPNGDAVADFNGSSQYLTIPSKAPLSIPTTGNLTWEGWIRPDALQFTNDGGGGYVDWMGKCADYSPTCEWEARMYSTTNSESRCNRISAYVFNPTAGLGSAADWQPTCGLIQAGQWYHVVGEYTTATQPSDCTSATTYPGSINIWVNGVEWDHASHGQTGCMSQYSVVPTANGSPLNIGTMALDTWFPGAIGKVAVYDVLLTATQITAHYRAMMGSQPAGSCADSCSL